MELFKDGTGVGDENRSITWRAENGRFFYTASGYVEEKVWDYTISGSTLTLKDNGGETATYQKKKK